MLPRTFILSIITFLLLGCNSAIDQQKTENQIREAISGDWELIPNKDQLRKSDYPLPIFAMFAGMGIAFSNDSIESYTGFFDLEPDANGDFNPKYLGSFTPFKLINDTILFKYPTKGNIEFKWRFIDLRNDTLQLAIEDTFIANFKRIYYKQDTFPQFDQIIYSSSGCYGACPIIDISITSKGNVLFQGQGFVKQLGLYSSNLTPKLNKYIFDKFRQANPLGLLDDYDVGYTDAQTISTTFIQNGKIVKTIHDYGRDVPRELNWAYVPISNVHSTIQLDSLPIRDPFYPEFQFSTFEKDGLELQLDKSESFFLWTELKSSTQTNKTFRPIYSIALVDNSIYLRPDPSEKTASNRQIISITTDGQFYRFEFKSHKILVYDLGYNFIDRNYKASDFREPIVFKDPTP